MLNRYVQSGSVPLVLLLYFINPRRIRSEGYSTSFVCVSVCVLQLSLVPRPFLYGRGEKGEGKKGLVNNSTPTRIHGCIPAVSVDEGKRECQVGVSRE